MHPCEEDGLSGKRINSDLVMKRCIGHITKLNGEPLRILSKGVTCHDFHFSSSFEWLIKIRRVIDRTVKTL